MSPCGNPLFHFWGMFYPIPLSSWVLQNFPFYISSLSFFLFLISVFLFPYAIAKSQDSQLSPDFHEGFSSGCIGAFAVFWPHPESDRCHTADIPLQWFSGYSPHPSGSESDHPYDRLPSYCVFAVQLDSTALHLAHGPCGPMEKNKYTAAYVPAQRCFIFVFFRTAFGFHEYCILLIFTSLMAIIYIMI